VSASESRGDRQSRRRAQSAVVGVALLLAITAISLGALTATVGVLVEENAAAATGEAVSEGFADLVAPGPAGVRRATVPLGDGGLRTVDRAVTVRNETGTVARVNGSALVWDAPDRRVVALGGAVVDDGAAGERMASAPTVAVDDRTALLGLATVAGEPRAVDGAPSTRVSLVGDTTVTRQRLPPGEYSLAVETSTPEAWERTLSAHNATVTRTGDDGDGTATVVATFPPNRRLDLVVRRIRLEVRP